MEDLGYYPIVEFKTFPSIVYFNPKLSVTLSVIHFDTQVVVKAAKHFFIRGMETKGETGIYSRLQEITKFTEYLKHNIEDWHLQTYYISDITQGLHSTTSAMSLCYRNILRNQRRTSRLHFPGLFQTAVRDISGWIVHADKSTAGVNDIPDG